MATHPVIEQAVREGRTVLTEAEAAAVLSVYGLPQPREALAITREQTLEAARRLGFPVVLKLCSPDILHKSEVGGVRLGLGDEGQVASAYDALESIAAERGARWGGVLVQEHVSGAAELIVGARFDLTFGPVVLVGLGGILAELIEDRAVRLAPVSVAEARSMLEELRGYRLLAGYRGRSGVNLAALADLITAVSRVPGALPVAELDLNPVIAGVEGRPAVAVDRRLILRRLPSEEPMPEPDPEETRAAVKRLLAPSSVAVVGASRDARKIGGRLLEFLIRHGFPGRIFAVTPNAAALGSVPSVPSVQDLPEPVDVACVVTPPETCAGVLQACGEKGIRSAIVFTSGFAETGNIEGERQLRAAGRAAGVRFCGPNSLGILNPEARFCASFSGILAMSPLPGGEIAYLSQSGALGGAFISRLWDRGIAIRRFVSVGNQTDLDLADYLDALLEDAASRVIALFVEGVTNGRKLCRALARAREAGKPVVVYKAGRSEEGRATIRSHTGVLAGDDAVWTAALRQSGAVRVTTMPALFDAAVALAWQPPPAGPRVGIISTSGGAAGILADECRQRGFEVPALSPDAMKRVQAEIPAFGAARNPVDVTAQVLARPAMLRNTLRILADDPAIDAILLMMTTMVDPLAEEIAGDVLATVRGLRKPVLVGWIVAPSLARKGMARLIAGKVPFYDSPDRVVVALAALAEWARLGRTRVEAATAETVVGPDPPAA
ncbi:MAG: acetate--CoA ligase family protein [Candidatus Rokuibacteriota bacterium]